jgi:hypothetical protein
MPLWSQSDCDFFLIRRINGKRLAANPIPGRLPITSVWPLFNFSIMNGQRALSLAWDNQQSSAARIRQVVSARSGDAATSAVQRHVIERIHRLNLLTVDGRCGHAVRKYKLVKSDGLADLVFQSVRQGKPMRDNNILTHHIKSAARALGLEFVNWRCLRTS